MVFGEEYADARPVAEGPVATLYRARSRSLGHEVALKVFREPVADDAAAARFREECAALHALGTLPHVAPLVGGGLTPERRPFVVTAWYPAGGRTVGTRLTVEQAVPVVTDAAAGLAAAHARWLVHGHVCPQNLLRGEHGTDVTDFGVSARPVPPVTSPEQAWTAPEVLRDRASLSPAADVHGLAASLYTVLGGEPPLPPVPGETAAEYLARRGSGRVPRLPDDVPPALARVVLDALAPDPADRPGSVLELAGAVRGAAGRAGAVDPLGAVRPAAAAPVSILEPAGAVEQVSIFEATTAVEQVSIVEATTAVDPVGSTQPVGAAGPDTTVHAAGAVVTLPPPEPVIVRAPLLAPAAVPVTVSPVAAPVASPASAGSSGPVTPTRPVVLPARATPPSGSPTVTLPPTPTSAAAAATTPAPPAPPVTRGIPLPAVPPPSRSLPQVPAPSTGRRLLVLAAAVVTGVLALVGGWVLLDRTRADGPAVTAEPAAGQTQDATTEPPTVTAGPTTAAADPATASAAPTAGPTTSAPTTSAPPATVTVAPARVTVTGTRATARATVRVSGPARFAALRLVVLDAAGRRVAVLADRSGSTVASTVTLSGSRDFRTAAGRYTAVVAWSLDGTTTSRGGRAPFTVKKFNADGVRLGAVRAVVGADGTVVLTGVVEVSRPVTFEYLQLAVRGPGDTASDSAGDPFDVGFNEGATVRTTLTVSGSRTYPADRYTVGLAYRLTGGSWVGGPLTSFTVEG